METTQEQQSNVNVGKTERIASLAAGGVLTGLGVKKRGVVGAALASAGAYLAKRGATGHCEAYDMLNRNTSVETNPDAVSVPHEQGIHVVKSVTVNRPVRDLYIYWRNFENLPKIMSHLERVEVSDGNHSHWVAKGPAGMNVEWDAEIINEVPNQVIGWRSLKDASIANAGSVQFNELSNGRGTEIKVTLEYVPPAGKVGQMVAKLFGKAPEQEIEADLRKFKALMETGEIPSTEGQPSGRSEAAE